MRLRGIRVTLYLATALAVALVLGRIVLQVSGLALADTVLLQQIFWPSLLLTAIIGALALLADQWMTS